MITAHSVTVAWASPPFLIICDVTRSVNKCCRVVVSAVWKSKYMNTNFCFSFFFFFIFNPLCFPFTYLLSLFSEKDGDEVFCSKCLGSILTVYPNIVLFREEMAREMSELLARWVETVYVDHTSMTNQLTLWSKLIENFNENWTKFFDCWWSKVNWAVLITGLIITI